MCDEKRASERIRAEAHYNAMEVRPWVYYLLYRLGRNIVLCAVMEAPVVHGCDT